jgi:hypothetical protein
VLIQQAVSHHPFITTSHNHWQNKGFVYQRKFPVFLHHFTHPLTAFFSLSVTEFISEGEIFHRINHFSHKLVQFYVAELAIVIGKFFKSIILIESSIIYKLFQTFFTTLVSSIATSRAKTFSWMKITTSN